MINVTLTNVKYFAAMSRETDCFTATIRINGKVASQVENDGGGGPDDFSDRRVRTLLDNLGKSLPKITYKGVELEQDAEMIVGELLQKHLQRKKMLSTMRTKLVFTDPNKPGELFQTKTQTIEQIAKWCADPAATCAKIGADVILNILPEDEALAIWMQGI